MGKQIRQRYTDKEYEAIEKAAQQTGLTMSAFAKNAVLEKVYGKQAKGHYSQIDLLKLMKDGLEELEPGSTFIVSDLIDKSIWDQLTRSEKNTVSKQLAKTVRESDDYSINGITPARVTQYIKS